jgi:hypothetical protein
VVRSAQHATAASAAVNADRYCIFSLTFIVEPITAA